MSASGTFGRRGGQGGGAGEDLAARRAAIRAERFAPTTDASPDEDQEAGAIAIPWVTVGLIALFTVIWLGEVRFGFEHGAAAMSWRTTVALGGVDRALVVGEGQWWRLFTAPLLHGSVEHLAGNAAVLAFAGFGLERLIGRGWFAAIFAFGAIAGSIASLSLNSPWMVSVGASGGIMALLAATFVTSFHPEAHEYGARMRWWVYRLAIPSLIPFGAAGGGHVDYSCHIGGALAGMAFGWALQFLWSDDQALPPLRGAAAIAAASAGLAAVVAFGFAASAYPTYAARQKDLIPEAMMPKGVAQDLERAASLSALYPHDPRGHLLLGLAAAKSDDAAELERQARAGLAEHDILTRDFPPALEEGLDAMLALSLGAQQRLDEGRAAAAPVCRDPGLIPNGGKIRAQLDRMKLC